MPKIIRTYASANGTIHNSLDEATVGDILALLGNEAFSRQVFEARDDLMAIFLEHEKLRAKEISQ